MLCVTTPTVDRREIAIYLGIVAAEVIEGAGGFADLAAAMRDGWGGRSATYEKLYRGARQAALDEITGQAQALRANAIVGVRFAYQILGQENGMLMIAASGTAVALIKTAEEKLLDSLYEKEEAAAHFVMINGAEKGPFSIKQLRELLTKGALTTESPLRSENMPAVTCVADLVHRRDRK